MAGDRVTEPPYRRVSDGADRDATPGGVRSSLAEKLRGWPPVLVDLGIEARDAVLAARRALHNGTTLQMELVAASLVREETLYRTLADHLGLQFLDTIDPERLTLGSTEAMSLLGSMGPVHAVRYIEEGSTTSILVAPDRFDLEAMYRWVARRPESEVRLRLVTPSAYREALVHRARPALVDRARDGLFTAMPHMSARFATTGWQGMVLGALLVALPVSAFVVPVWSLFAIHIVATLFFFGCVVLRYRAALDFRPLPVDPPKPLDPMEAPVYTVLIALYQEAEVVPELLVALGRIVWPRAKLQVRLVCERDDRATIEAIRLHGLRSWIDVIEVPLGMPRTKPNALAYALPQTSGELVVLYDAEDRPHPLQLVEAWHRFRDDDPGLACLQAPIDIDNASAGLIPRLFAAEYAALFRGLLPWLARRGLLLRWAARPIISAAPRLRKWRAGTLTTSPRMPISACGLPASASAPGSCRCRRWRMRRTHSRSGCASAPAG